MEDDNTRNDSQNPERSTREDIEKEDEITDETAGIKW